MVNDRARSGAEDEASGDRFTEEDLLLGKKATKLVGSLSVTALVACVRFAVFVFLSVPCIPGCPMTGSLTGVGVGFRCRSRCFPVS